MGKTGVHHSRPENRGRRQRPENWGKPEPRTISVKSWTRDAVRASCMRAVGRCFATCPLSGNGVCAQNEETSGPAKGGPRAHSAHQQLTHANRLKPSSPPASQLDNLVLERPLLLVGQGLLLHPVLQL